jgi:hypothetical protein
MKTNNTNTWAIPIAVLVLSLAFATTAFAAGGAGQVDASVEMQQYCVNLDLGSSLSFGAAALGEEATEVDDHAITIRNSGSGDAQIMIQGTDAAGPDGATWALADNAGPGEFAWYFVDAAPDSERPQVFVSKDARVLIDSLSYHESVAFNAVMLTPTCSTRPGIFTWSATIYAVPVPEN